MRTYFNKEYYSLFFYDHKYIMSIQKKNTKLFRWPYLRIDGDFTLDPLDPFNVLLVDLSADAEITLPELTEIVLGYYVWIKRVDEEAFDLTVTPAVGNTIDGLADLTLSASEGVCIIADDKTGDWALMEGFNNFTTSVRDLDLESPDPPGQIVYNDNPGAYLGIGLYYSDGVTWNLITNSGSATVNTSGIITGDGSGGDPVRAIDGTSNGQIFQWDSTGPDWGLVNGLFTEYVFVDLDGDDATGEVNNPFRPFATISGAKAEAIAYGAPITVYVRAGTHTCDVNLIAQDVYYYFAPNSVIDCSVIPFLSTVATDAVDFFAAYGYGQFTSANDYVVDISGNINSMYIEAFSMASVLSTAVRINLASVEAHIYVSGSVTSALGSAIELRGGSGIIKADFAIGATNGVIFTSSNGTWEAHVRYVLATGGVGLRCNSSTQNSKIFADEITSVTGTALSHSSGNLYCHARIIRTAVATNALQCSAGTLYVEGFDSIITEAADSSLLISGGTISCIGRRIGGIFSSAGSGIAKIHCCILDSPASGIYAICINTTSAINLEVYANTISGINTPTIRNISSGAAVMKIYTQSLSTTLAQPVFYMDCANSTVYLNVQNVLTASTSTLFNCIAGNIFVDFQNLVSTITSPLFIFDENVVANIRGKTISTSGSVFSIPNTATTANITWDVASCTSTADTVFDIASNTAFVLNMRDVYANCTWNDAAGHVMTITPGGGASVYKFFNCVFTKTNAGADILNAAGATNVLLYGFLTSNDTSVNITYQVGTNTVDPLVV